MPDPARPAGSARVPASGHSLVGDAPISASAREQRADAGSCPFGGGPYKARTPRACEACREYSPRDPSRNASIQQSPQVASKPITTTCDSPYCYGFRTSESTAAPWPTTASQNTSLSAYSQHTPFPARRASTDGARTCTCIALTKAEPCTSTKHAPLQTHGGRYEGRNYWSGRGRLRVPFVVGYAWKCARGRAGQPGPQARPRAS